MKSTLITFDQITQAEDYFAFFGLPYDPQFLNVNRLHILQKFSRLMKEKGTANPDMEDTTTFNQYRELLQEAYSLFQTSSPQAQKLFKVFNQKPSNVVLMSEIEVE
ncbi:nitrogenase-stabilizing/protective protein NifW [Nodosilinea sp. PGN35]|uniref:nitrogenase-stabilizing/protective protein NifW n=1 Tax=Nodosilinea sp. PGN35 TaxID=3020489 RepID=UPI0023B23102|nr:nitrogenase-stabilizing/protective protein NifW [Nodosilinea sp. TSF1-S3]MDF0367149.1 nitrogenase-stabilizing/protective protein NifW [Nodosilinea sp. TSF1-S3]